MATKKKTKVKKIKIDYKKEYETIKKFEKSIFNQLGLGGGFGFYFGIPPSEQEQIVNEIKILQNKNSSLESKNFQLDNSNNTLKDLLKVALKDERLVIEAETEQKLKLKNCCD